MKTNAIERCIQECTCSVTSEIARVQLTAIETALAAKNEALRLAARLMEQGQYMCLDDNAVMTAQDAAKAALSPPTGKVLVEVEELLELEWSASLGFSIEFGREAIFACCPNCARLRPIPEDERDREYHLCKSQFGFVEGHSDNCWLGNLPKAHDAR